MENYSEVNSSGAPATHRFSSLKHSALSLIMVWVFISTARADLTAINLSSVVQLNSGAGDETLGWEFAPTRNLMVTQLGPFYSSRTTMRQDGFTKAFFRAIEFLQLSSH